MLSAKSILLALTIIGCIVTLTPSAAIAADAKVTGEIRVRGKLLAAGKVAFHLENGQFVGSKVKDGQFAIDRVLVGRYKVTVDGEGVPAKYNRDDASALTVEVMEGQNAFSFDLR